MSDNFSEVTSESWLSRLGGAIKGVLIGGVLLFLATVVLWWNEGRAVKEYKALAGGNKACVAAESAKVDPALEGKLVYVSGQAEAKSAVSDPLFGVSAPALKLRRVVEIYQWQEKKDSKTEKKLGGGTETVTTYNYDKTWSGSLTSSADFKQQDGHVNPAKMLCESASFAAQPVTLGARELPDFLLSQVDGWKPLPVAVAGTLAEPVKAVAKLQNGGYYLGKDAAAPEVGDVRVRFEVVNAGPFSVVAQQSGTSFGSWKAANGGTVALIQSGAVPMQSMFAQAQASSQKLTWILRFVGCLVLFIGFNMLMRPLSVLADVLPILGDFVEAGLGFVALLLALMWGFLVISVAWIVNRPLVGVPLLLVAGVLAWQLRAKMAAKSAKRKSAVAANGAGEAEAA